MTLINYSGNLFLPCFVDFHLKIKHSFIYKRQISFFILLMIINKCIIFFIFDFIFHCHIHQNNMIQLLYVSPILWYHLVDITDLWLILFLINYKFFLNSEPGYYEETFGIRIEDIVLVKDATTDYKMTQKPFLQFETVTMCPIQSKMLVLDLLTDTEVRNSIVLVYYNVFINCFKIV